MLSKKSRLNLKKEEDREVFNYRVKETDYFAFFAKVKKIGEFRAGVVIPIKIVKKAFQRNRIRRKIFNIIKDHQIKNTQLDLLVLLKTTEEKLNKVTTRELHQVITTNLTEIGKKLKVF